MRIAESVGGGGEVAGRLRKIDCKRAVGVELAALCFVGYRLFGVVCSAGAGVSKHTDNLAINCGAII